MDDDATSSRVFSRGSLDSPNGTLEGSNGITIGHAVIHVPFHGFLHAAIHGPSSVKNHVKNDVKKGVKNNVKKGVKNNVRIRWTAHWGGRTARRSGSRTLIMIV